MKLPGQLRWAGLLLAGSLAAQPQLPPETVFGRAGPEAAGLSGATVTAPVSPRASGLREALEKTPGLFLQESFGGIEPPRLAVRGSGIQSAPVSRGVRLQLDGFPLNFADGSFNTGLMETAWLDHAELTPGPSAGVATLGGELSLWSKLIEPYEGGEARATVGQDSSRSLVAWQRLAHQKQNFAAGVSLRRTDGWREYSKQRRESVMATFRSPLGADERWELQGHLLAARPRIEVPGPLTRSQAFQNPETVIPRARSDRPYRESEYLRLAGSLTKQSSEGYLSIGASGIFYEDEFRQLLPNGISRASAREGALFLDLQRDWDTSWEQRTDARLSLHSGWNTVTRHRNAGGTSGARMGDNRMRPDTWTLALDHTVSPRPEWEFEVGGSLLHARREITERFDTSGSRPSTALNLKETKLAPRVAINWLPSENFRMTLALARSYEPPTFDDLLFTTGPLPARQLASKPLDWQRADQIELSLQGGGPNWNWRVAAYEGRWKREFLRLLDKQGNPRGAVNADETRRTGLEVALDRSLYELNSLTLRGWTAWQWTYYRFDDDPVFGDNRIAGIAPFSGALGLEVATADGWFLAPSVRGQTGNMYVDHANTLDAPGFAVWTIDAGRHHPSGWSVYLRVENLFDKKYIASPAGVLDRAGSAAKTTVFLPGAGRRWEMGINYTW
ncbi:MAG: TonB-dependent receptor domain-containing protein [Opitutales bacterium]